MQHNQYTNYHFYTNVIYPLLLHEGVYIIELIRLGSVLSTTSHELYGLYSSLGSYIVSWQLALMNRIFATDLYNNPSQVNHPNTINRECV